MFGFILITLGLVLIIVGIVGLVITTIQKVKFNDNTPNNQVNAILMGTIFFLGTLLAAAGGAFL